MQYITENLAKIQVNLPDKVTLVAVSKTVPMEQIAVAYDAGVRYFGENRVQELLQKLLEGENLLPEAKWHLIGHLQTNKVRQVVGKVSLIHSVDSLRLAGEINRVAQQMGIRQDILVQVNLAREDSKFGLDAHEVRPLLDEMAKMPHIRVRGLMTMAPFVEDPEMVRPLFRDTRVLFDVFGTEYKHAENMPMDTLSMGMSGDYVVAVEEGATIVRVGSGVFG